MTKHRKNQAPTPRTPGSLAWLMARNRQGQRRIDRLSWGRLARIYDSRSATADIRKAIENAARRCGYTPSTILGLNRWN